MDSRIIGPMQEPLAHPRGKSLKIFHEICLFRNTQVIIIDPREGEFRAYLFARHLL